MYLYLALPKFCELLSSFWCLSCLKIPHVNHLFKNKLAGIIDVKIQNEYMDGL